MAGQRRPYIAIYETNELLFSKWPLGKNERILMLKVPLC